MESYVEFIKAHLKKYGGKKYRRYSSKSEYNENIYPNMKESGEKSCKFFKEIVDEINNQIKNKKYIEYKKIWQNSDNMKDYFWAQFKDNENSASSISLFAYASNFTICIEWDDKVGSSLLNKHKQYITYIDEWIEKFNLNKENYQIVNFNSSKSKLSEFSINEIETIREVGWIKLGKKFDETFIEDISFVEKAIKLFDELDWLYKKTFTNSEDKNKIINDIEETNVIEDEKYFDVSTEEDKREYREINSNKEELQYIKEYIKSKGYSYSSELIDNLYLSLKAKPFVILSGISGTGKSKIVKLFAEAIGATRDNGRFNLISVRPDWTDDSELLGYRDIEGNFKVGAVTSILKAANDNLNEPYFICLDEMNLARVEYYFSTILSIIETKELIDGEIRSNKIFTRESFGTDKESYEIYKDVYISENIFIVGTVNMDETTFPFSKKVLDRANTIEFNEIDLDFDFLFDKEEIQGRVYDNTLLKSNYLKITDCLEDKKTALKVIENLKRCNEILIKGNYHFAYRTRDEIIFYVINAVKYKSYGFL